MRYVLFVCTHNAGRSQMAQAFFNKYAPEDLRAESAGQEPAPGVWPEVVEVMREKDIDLATAKPQRLTAELAADAQWLVTMGCGDECPVVSGTRRDDWPLEDPKGKPRERVREIRDDIEARVKRLISTNGWS